MIHVRAAVAAASLAALALASGCGDLLTEAPRIGDDFESPFEGLPPELNAVFAEGDANFERVFSVEEGLGPIFNQAACGGCHPGDGRGSPEEALVRFSRGADLVPGEGGPQLQDKAIPGVVAETLPPGVDTSVRLPPPVFGVGLIEHVPAESILARADPADADADGISGRPNLVYVASYVPGEVVGGGDGVQLGRFGRKASVSSLLEQVVSAYHQDMGITSDFLPVEDPHAQAGGIALGDRAPDPEIPASDVLETVVYVRLLAPPARGPITPSVLQGEALFEQLRCSACHVPSLRTGPSDIAPLDRAAVPLYSDLLLHDMGPRLADNRPDGDATGTEWRTAPLWGTRLVRKFLGGRAFFLHDGRATTLDEAIRLHGGEAEDSREGYGALDAAGRDALIAFLESL